MDKITTLLSGLIFDCPMCLADTKCPLVEIRKLSAYERVAYLKGLSQKEKLRLVELHREHLKMKDND